MKKRIIPVLVLLLVGLVTAQWMVASNEGGKNQQRFEERVNLALRQVGHQLLAAAGNQTSPIPPIAQKSSQEFILTLDNPFNYDTLPSLVDRAFQQFEISNPYQVIIRSCQSDSIILGFDYLAVLNKEVACQGREMVADCSQVHLAFTEKNAGLGNQSFLLLLSALTTLILLVLLFQKFGNTRSTVQEVNPIHQENISLGRFTFDVPNQVLMLGADQVDLTFREAKLLHYFASRPNEVLKREEILSNVWEDEGVIVGRSLDVFVSRLRKILKPDPSVSLKNVHGVGYRLELSES